MKRETSYGAIVFRRERGVLKYLLLHYSAGHWEFPRGHPEKGESELQTVLRELKEETGITKIEFVKGFKKDFSFYFKRARQLVLKKAVFYLIQTSEKKVRLSKEHKGFCWCRIEDAIKLLTFENSKKIIKSADSFLQKKQCI